MDSGKYYWLKLKRDFFKRHDIRIIEDMPNGKDYILFYLKLLLESIDHNGSLRFSDTIPYNEQMLSVVTNTNIDIVRSAMRLFIELNMMSICDDKTIYMTEVEKLIGSETKWAEKKRLQRAKEDNVPTLSQNCPTEKEKEKDKETNIESYARDDATIKMRGAYRNVNLTDEQYADLCERIPGFDSYLDTFSEKLYFKRYRYPDHYKAILEWWERDKTTRKPVKKGAGSGSFDITEFFEKATKKGS